MSVIPKFGLGTWKSPNNDVLVKAVTHAIENASYKHIDCAACYENEDVVGKAFKDLFDDRKVVDRKDIWITSKLWNTKHQPDLVEGACRETLRNLNLKYLDLYLMHYSIAFKPGDDYFPRDSNGKIILDPSNTGIVDTWLAMEQLVKKGLVKNIGVSNFTINMLEVLKYDPRVSIRPYTNQVEFHLYNQQNPLREYMAREGILLTGYSVLGTNDWKKPNEPTVLEDKVLKEVASEVNVTPAAAEIQFLRQLAPQATLLAKSVTPSRITDNIKQHCLLSQEQVARLVARNRNYRFVNPKVNWGIDVLGDGW